MDQKIEAIESGIFRVAPGYSSFPIQNTMLENSVPFVI